jgi:hypothetical protein
VTIRVPVLYGWGSAGMVEVVGGPVDVGDLVILRHSLIVRRVELAWPWLLGLWPLDFGTPPNAEAVPRYRRTDTVRVQIDVVRPEDHAELQRFTPFITRTTPRA